MSKSSELHGSYVKKFNQTRESNIVPTIVMGDDIVGKIDFDYSTRAPGDYAVSGPISGRGAGPGREFLSANDAEDWGREYFGNRFKHRIFESEKGGRWAFLVIPKLG